MPDSNTVAAANVSEPSTRPSQVSTAALLIAASLVLGVINSGLFMPRVRGAEAFVVQAITLAILSCLAYMTWLGRNWARVIFAVLYFAGLPFTIPFFVGTFRLSVASGCISVLQALLQLVALYLLFTNPGRGWFSAKPGVA